jgi:hypothetical protein
MVDIQDVERIDECFNAGKRHFAASGDQAMTIVPMNKDDTAIRTISVVCDVRGPLGDTKMVRLKTFADQVVAALESVRISSGC